jgi:hypothetical protein
MDLLRQEFNQRVRDALNARKALHRTMQNGGVSTTGNYSKRLPAWATIQIMDEPTAPVIAMNRQGFQGKYNQFHGRPKGPSLKSLNIRRVTGYAEKMNLTLEIEVEFEVFTFEDFELYARYYLRRHPDRKPLKISWGHGDSFNGRGIVVNSIEGAMVLGGGYTNSELNTYVCKFNAIGPANAICELDLFGVKDFQKIFPGNKFVTQRNSNDGGYNVTNIIQKIMHDLQWEQNSNLRITSKRQDGYEPILNSTGGLQPGPARVGKIFNAFDGSKAPNGLNRFFNTNAAQEQTGIESDAHEYVSLEYVVWLINSTVLKTVNDKCGNQLEFRIDFMEAGKHYSAIPTDLTHFRSANPVEVLFLDKEKKSGNYTVANDSSVGKDFTVTPNAPSSFEDCVNVSLGRLNHKKILLERRMVIAPIIDVLRMKSEDEKDSKKESVRNDRGTDNILRLKNFFDALFEKINRASGGYVNLSLVNYDPAYSDRKKLQRLRIMDTHTVSNDPARLIMLDPVKGDGSSFRVTVDGKLPDNLVALSLLPGLGEGSNINAKYCEDDARLSDLLQQSNELRTKLVSQDITNGCYAKLAADAFSDAAVQDCVSTLSEYRKLKAAIKFLDGQGFEKFDFVEYFDVFMNIEMEGAFPIIAGNVFSSTNLPSFARPDNKIGFVALDIEDRIEAPGTWTTIIQSRMCPYV